MHFLPPYWVAMGYWLVIGGSTLEQLIMELNARFPAQTIMNALGVVYSQY